MRSSTHDPKYLKIIHTDERTVQYHTDKNLKKVWVNKDFVGWIFREIARADWKNSENVEIKKINLIAIYPRYGRYFRKKGIFTWAKSELNGFWTGEYSTSKNTLKTPQ